MKTPNEIKADAATCLTRPQHSACNRFALYQECKGDCGYVIKELYDLVLHLESRLAQVERERDAAVADLRLYDGCKVCKYGDFTFTQGCRDCSYDNNNWEWRGPCPENTNDLS